MEAHVAEGVDVSEKDIDQIIAAAKAGKPWREVFPQLAALDTQVTGEGVEIKVKFSKREGAPVRFMAADDPEEAAAVREVPLQNKYRYSPTQLAQIVGLSVPKSKVLREHLGIDNDGTCMYLFEFGSQKHPRFSDRAVQRMRDEACQLDLEALWQARRRRA